MSKSKPEPRNQDELDDESFKRRMVGHDEMRKRLGAIIAKEGSWDAGAHAEGSMVACLGLIFHERGPERARLAIEQMVKLFLCLMGHGGLDDDVEMVITKMPPPHGTVQ